MHTSAKFKGRARNYILTRVFACANNQVQTSVHSSSSLVSLMLATIALHLKKNLVFLGYTMSQDFRLITLACKGKKAKMHNSISFLFL